MADGITATNGADTLYGAGGSNDVLQGLGGDDTLTGDTGSDTYVYNLGDGHDTIVEAANASDIDTLALGAGIGAASLTVTRSVSNPDDVLVQFADGGSVLLKGEFAAATGTGVERVSFADGTVWSRDDLKSAALALGPHRGQRRDHWLRRPLRRA